MAAGDTCVKGGLGGHDGDLDAFKAARDASAARSDEAEDAIPIEIQFHQSAERDPAIRREVGPIEGIEIREGFGEFVGFFGLPDGEVSGFEAAGIVFGFRLAAGIGGVASGFEGGADDAIILSLEVGADGGDDGGFLDGRHRSK